MTSRKTPELLKEVPADDKPKVVIGEIIPPPNGSKLTPQTTQTICEFLLEGNYASTACRAAGVSYESYRQWLRRGERETDGPYHEFYLAVTQARALGEATLIQEIRNAARQPHTWMAAAWLLERTQPDKYGRSNRIELIARDRIRERAEEEGLDPEEIASMAARLALEAGEEDDDADQES